MTKAQRNRKSPTMHSRQSFSTMKMTNFDNIPTPKVVRRCPTTLHVRAKDAAKGKVGIRRFDPSRYKLSQEEVMRRKQVRSTPVNTGPINRSSIRKSKQKQQQRSAALTPSRTPVARDNKGNVAWMPTGRNTKQRAPKTPKVQVISPSSCEPELGKNYVDQILQIRTNTLPSVVELTTSLLSFKGELSLGAFPYRAVSSKESSRRHSKSRVESKKSIVATESC